MHHERDQCEGLSAVDPMIIIITTTHISHAGCKLEIKVQTGQAPARETSSSIGNDEPIKELSSRVDI